jgi:hypothetical protein
MARSLHEEIARRRRDVHIRQYVRVTKGEHMCRYGRVGVAWRESKSTVSLVGLGGGGCAAGVRRLVAAWHRWWV